MEEVGLDCKYEGKSSVWVASMKTLVREVNVHHFHLQRYIYLCYFEIFVNLCYFETFVIYLLGLFYIGFNIIYFF
ncbi:hypothetical protein HanRHA438_Chr15g0696841 [Helianthus annuus]|nr:hypothetical protein HanRHA438_Chr15g0696841 [Helianthus annuus]